MLGSERSELSMHVLEAVASRLDEVGDGDVVVEEVSALIAIIPLRVLQTATQMAWARSRRYLSYLWTESLQASGTISPDDWRCLSALLS
jgi:hypothetical protein